MPDIEVKYNEFSPTGNPCTMWDTFPMEDVSNVDLTDGVLLLEMNNGDVACYPLANAVKIFLPAEPQPKPEDDE